MPYIGKPASTSFTETVKDSFNGDNSTTAFTMSQSVSLDTDIEVFVGNVQQEPGSGKAYVVSGTTLTFSEAPPTGTGNIYVIHRNSLQGTLLPPQNLGDRNYLIGGDLSLDADSAALKFGADSDITLTHSADTGLVLKNTSTTGNSGIGAVLTLQTGDTDIAQNNVLGRIDFQAPDEGTGTDAILVAASIRAVANAAFSSSVNTTSLEFMTGASEAATRKMSVTANGNVDIFTDGASIEFGADSEIKLTHVADTGLILKHTATADDKPVVLTLQTGETDIAQDDILGKIQFQAPDEGTGTDAILVAAGIQAISEGDFSSSSNATTLQFLTGASEAASAKMSLTSGGDVNVLTDGASIFFGADSEIELRHVADDGLILKHVGTGDGKEPSLTFQAGDNDIAQDDVLGSIFFQAPDEGAGTDAVLVAAGIEAVSEGDFSSSSNATSLIFKTGASETATEKVRLKSDGKLGVGVTPTVQFHVLSSSAQSIATFAHPSSSTAAVNGGALVAIQNTNSTAGNQSSLVFNDSAGEASSGIFGFNTDHSSHEGFLKLCTRNSGGTFAERMRIASDGKIGMGGTLNTAHLFVQDPLEGTSTQIATIKAKGSSYGTEAVNIFSERAAATAFSFMRMHSNDNADVEFNFRGDGQGLADGGTFNNPADYAEFFEWKDGNSSDEDRIGYSVILDGNKIVKATSSDDTSKIVGVISGNPVVVGDCAWNRWEGKFVKDDYNRYVREEYTVTEWKDSEGESIQYVTDEIPSDVTVPSDAKVISTEVDGVTKLTRRKVNSSWDKSKTYIPREDRKEWDMVGMVGKLYLRKGQPTGDRWIKMKDISDTVEEWLVR